MIILRTGTKYIHIATQMQIFGDRTPFATCFDCISSFTNFIFPDTAFSQ